MPLNETVGYKLNFTWNVTKRVNSTLEVQLNFTSPLDISAGENFDWMTFKIKNYSDILISNTTKKLAFESKTLNSTVPR